MQEKGKPITFAGLFLSIFGYLLIVAVTSLPFFSNTMAEKNLTMLGLFLIWLLTLLLLSIIKFGEKRPFESIGLKSITIKEVLLAIGIGVVLSLAVPVLTLLFSQIIPATGGDIGEAASTTTWWVMLMSILTAGITEEIIFRGYLIERIHEFSNKKAIAILVSVIAFVLPHMLSWNIPHVIAVVLPMGLILSLIYLWKRNLVFNIIIHIVIDLPLVVMALLSA